MWKDAVMLTVACVLYINMGLHAAIVERTGIDLRITGCPKCASFWVTLASNIIHRCPFVECLAVSFLCSYSALWLTLGYEAMTKLYNNIYDKISNPGNAEAASDEDPEADTDALPTMP